MFELHCTVENYPPQFKKMCEAMDIKLIEIALLDENHKEITRQLMTSIQTKFYLSNEWKKLKHIADICGAKIVRTKVETSLYNKHSAKYYETHFQSEKKFDLPASQRLDKKDNTSYTIRATNIEEFNQKYQQANAHLYTKRIEKCILDTNQNYDGNWI